MKATYINIGECGYAEVYPLEGGTYDGRMLNLDSRESFPWFKGHEPLYCLGNNGCRRELFFDLGGARVSGTVYERIMTGQNVEVLSAMPAVVSDTFFMACEIYPPLSDVLLVKCSQLQDPRLKNSFGYVPAHFEKGLGIVFDEDILNPSLLISKVKKILAKRPALIPTFQSLFEGVSSDFFSKIS